MHPRRLLQVQRWVGIVFAIVVITLIADSLFLFLDHEATEFVAFMVQLHIWLGFALCAAVIGFVWPHFLVHRRHLNHRAKWIGFGLVSLITIGCATGIGLFVIGKSSAVQWLVWLHVGTFVLGLLGYAAHRLAAYATPVLWYELAGAAAVIMLFVGFGVTGWTGEVEETPSTDPNVQLAADFGLANTRTIDGHWMSKEDLTNPQYCAQCHTQIAEQWDGSAHHFSSQNDPFYAATFTFVQQNNPASSMKFCGGCHDPLMLTPGFMNEQPVTDKTPNAMEGITCLACHAVVEIPDRIGNGGYTLAPVDHYPFYDSDDPAEQEQNRRLIRSKPEKHKASFMKPFMRESEFCLSCHKTHLPVGLNNYKWKRGANDFDSWQMSTASMESGLTFYNAEKRQRCQDCHMPDVPSEDPAAKDGFARDHTFPGANSALAFVKNKPQWLEKTRQILKECATVDIFSAMVDPRGSAAHRVWPLDDHAVRFTPGTTVSVEVVVRNRLVGHIFPTGTVDLQEPWLEFEVRVKDSKTLYHSGWLDHTGRLDPFAHRYDNILLTREGGRVDVHQVDQFYTVLYNNAVQMGQSDVVRYEFDIPPQLPQGAELEIVATLHYRKFRREYTEFALGHDAPRMPIIEIDRDVVQITLGDKPMTGSPSPSPELAERVNDFGIAHLLQGDTLTATWAFDTVTQIEHNNADAWVNLARAMLADGKIDDVERVLREADRCRPRYHKTAFFLGQLRAAQGRHEEAIGAYDIAIEAFPRDRVMYLAKVEALYRLGRFEDAIAVAGKVLEIDPENLTAHTYLGRSYRALEDEAMAAKHHALEASYREQREEQRATRLYRRRFPAGDLEANVQHVHRLTQVRPADARADEEVVAAEAFPSDDKMNQ